MVRELRVRPRGDTAQFRGASRDVREAGRSLGVDVVVDGSVRRFDDVLRVSVRLIAVEDGFQPWARRFDRPVGRIVTVADDAAGAIARALAAELTAEARPVAADPVAQDLELFEGLRDRHDYRAVRAATAARADRVLHVLEPETLTLDG